MKPLLLKTDCVEFPVPDLDAAIGFYRDRLGHELIWRSATQAGLRMPQSDCEILLQTERPEGNVDWKVESADRAVEEFVRAGGTVEAPPFDIPIGRCAVVRDPWGNRLVLLDFSKGSYVTDSQGNIIGLKKE
jgi:predicted enzyme related to lactoylglutathione lyase